MAQINQGDQSRIVCLAGGVGGAKLAAGLAAIVPPERLTIIGNTGDDFVHLGLTICPDLDTLLYTLAGVADPLQGWGLVNESWRTLTQLALLGAPDWFRLGDRDLATHLLRTHLLTTGQTLTEATAALCRGFDVAVPLLPAGDGPAPTRLATDEGVLSFQEWFVHRRWQPRVEQVLLPDEARATRAAVRTVEQADIVIIAPSNPFVSIDPILNAYPLRALLADVVPVVVAVSPIIGSEAIKGPAAKMMREWGMNVSAQAVAEHYEELITNFVSDIRDATPVRLGEIETTQVDTLMADSVSRIRVAQDVLNFAQATLNQI